MIWFFRLVKLFCWPSIIPFFGIRVSGREKIPKGSVIFVANHGTYYDPLLLNAIFPWRKLYTLSSRTLFNCPALFQAFLRMGGAVMKTNPIQDMETMNQLAQKAAPYESFVYYAAGRISQATASFYDGASILAHQSGLPLVPVYLQVAPFFRGGSHIRFGNPRAVTATTSPQSADVSGLTEKLFYDVLELSQQTPKKRRL